ncbi:MAG: MFS transporter [Thermoplasmataceae archaeon]
MSRKSDASFNFLLLSRASRSVALSFSAISYPLYLFILGYNIIMIGFFAFFLILFTVFQTLLMGVIGDRFGYRFSLIVSEIFPIFSMSVLFFTTYNPLIYLTVIGGIGGGPGALRGAFSPGTTALIGNNWPDTNARVRKIGLVTTVGSLFSIFGGLLVVSQSFLSHSLGEVSSYRFLFGVSSLLMIISFVSLFFVTERQREMKKHGVIQKGSMRHLGKVILSNSVNGAGIGLSMAIISAWFHLAFGVSSFFLGIMFTGSYLATAAGSYISVRMAERIKNPGKLGAYARMLQGLLMIPIALSPFFYIAAIFYIFRMTVAGYGVSSRGTINLSGLKEGDLGAGTSFQATAGRLSQLSSGASGILTDLFIPLPLVLGGSIQFFAGVLYLKLFGKIPPE